MNKISKFLKIAFNGSNSDRDHNPERYKSGYCIAECYKGFDIYLRYNVGEIYDHWHVLTVKEGLDPDDHTINRYVFDVYIAHRHSFDWILKQTKLSINQRLRKEKGTMGKGPN